MPSYRGYLFLLLISCATTGFTNNSTLPLTIVAASVLEQRQTREAALQDLQARLDLDPAALRQLLEYVTTASAAQSDPQFTYKVSAIIREYLSSSSLPQDRIETIIQFLREQYPHSTSTTATIVDYLRLAMVSHDLTVPQLRILHVLLASPASASDKLQTANAKIRAIIIDHSRKFAFPPDLQLVYIKQIQQEHYPSTMGYPLNIISNQMKYGLGITPIKSYLIKVYGSTSNQIIRELIFNIIEKFSQDRDNHDELAELVMLSDYQRDRYPSEIVNTSFLNTLKPTYLSEPVAARLLAYLSKSPRPEHKQYVAAAYITVAEAQPLNNAEILLLINFLATEEPNLRLHATQAIVAADINTDIDADIINHLIQLTPNNRGIASNPDIQRIILKNVDDRINVTTSINDNLYGYPIAQVIDNCLAEWPCQVLPTLTILEHLSTRIRFTEHEAMGLYQILNRIRHPLSELVLIKLLDNVYTSSGYNQRDALYASTNNKENDYLEILFQLLQRIDHQSENYPERMQQVVTDPAIHPFLRRASLTALIDTNSEYALHSLLPPNKTLDEKMRFDIWNGFLKENSKFKVSIDVSLLKQATHDPYLPIQRLAWMELYKYGIKKPWYSIFTDDDRADELFTNIIGLMVLPSLALGSWLFLWVRKSGRPVHPWIYLLRLLLWVVCTTIASIYIIGIIFVSGLSHSGQSSFPHSMAKMMGFIMLGYVLFATIVFMTLQQRRKSAD